MRAGAAVAGALVALALLGALPGRAHTVLDRGPLRIELRGRLRELGTWTRATDREQFVARALASLPSLDCLRASGFADCPAFAELGEDSTWQSLTRLRTRLDASWGSSVSLELAYDHELRGGRLDTLEAQIGAGVATASWLDLDRDIHVLGLREGDDNLRWRHRIYRLRLRIERGPLELRVGKQRLPWGVGRLWTPIDRLNPIPPLALEPDESPGVDAVDLRGHWGGFQTLEAVWAPGSGRVRPAYAIRWHGVWLDTDLSLLAGIFERTRAVGFDLARNLGDAALRIEAVYTDPTQPVWRIGDGRPRVPSPYWQAVVSLDRRFAVGGGLYILIEHFYNGHALGFGRGRAGPALAFFEATARPPAGLAPWAAWVPGPYVRPAGPEILAGSRLVSFAIHQTGLELSYDLGAALALQGLAIVDWNGGSFAAVPLLRYTGFSFAELSVGAQLFGGPRRSQYGEAEPLVFVLIDFFF